MVAIGDSHLDGSGLASWHRRVPFRHGELYGYLFGTSGGTLGAYEKADGHAGAGTNDTVEGRPACC
jgi:hypothetical protein